jgi:serine phosphatase RsbU (regulator of sigma subunit)
MQKRLFAIAGRFWPELDTLNHQRKVLGAGEVITFLYSAPLALLGIVWLVMASDFSLAAREWRILLFLATLMFLFRKLGFFFITEIRAGRYASSDGSMESMILWIGLLLIGPVALWLAVFWPVVDFIHQWPKLHTRFDRWNRLRNFSFYQASTVLASLIALAVYTRLGGVIPLPGLTPGAIWPAFAAILVHFLLVLSIWLGFIAYAVWMQKELANAPAAMPVVRFLVLALGLPFLAHPFAILGAGLFVENGPLIFILFILGLVLVAALTRQLSQAAESNRQRSRQLENLEELGRRILNAPPDASTLPDLLRDCLPSMFPSGRYAVWVLEADLQVKHPEDWELDLEPVWQWLSEQTGPAAFLPKDRLAWQGNPLPHNALVVAPILEVESSRPIGGVYLELHNLVQPWDSRSLASLFPAVLSLSAQVGSALHQASIYAQALAYQKVTQELSLAGKIQASFLPDELPRLNGWQLAVTLLPARETSGDFFDLIPLSESKLGLLIADVTDKGVGAALYMALSRTLIRTYAVEFDEDPQPDVVLFAANGRLLKDARANLFVTAFYGILDLETGELTYANAGHNPPYLMRSKNGTGESEVVALTPTGMPLGIEEESVWNQELIRLNPGDVLVLYTDGIPDSQNSQGEFFQEDLLLEAVTGSQGRQANEIQDTILEQVQKFVGDAPQFDDITLMILSREESAVSIETEGAAGDETGAQTPPISEPLGESDG